MNAQASVAESDNGPLIAVYDQASRNGSLSIGSYVAFAESGGIPLVGGSNWVVALVDEDGATARKVAGKLSASRSDGDRPPRFEGGEHTAIGDGVILRFSPNDAGKPASQIPLQVQAGLELTYGQILAFAGDFYGVPGQPIADGPNFDDRKRRFQAAYNSLAAGSVAETRSILQIMQREIDAVNAALNQGQPPKTSTNASATSSTRLGTGRPAAAAPSRISFRQGAT